MIMTYALEEVQALYQKPLLDLIFEAAGVHRENHDASEMQMCTLLSIKTGGCAEDCKYCSQSIHNNADLEKEILMKTDEVLAQAKAAKEAGSTRFCMGLRGRVFLMDERLIVFVIWSKVSPIWGWKHV